MSEPTRLRPLREASRITQMLDLVLGVDRFDRAPVDIINLALGSKPIAIKPAPACKQRVQTSGMPDWQNFKRSHLKVNAA